MSAFEAALNDYQNFINAQGNPVIAMQTSSIITDYYARKKASGLGYTSNLDSVVDASLAPTAVSTVDKLANSIVTASDGVMKSLEAYYTAKGKVADLKLLAKGGTTTQALEALRKVGGDNTSNTLFIVGGGLLALYLLTRK